MKRRGVLLGGVLTFGYMLTLALLGGGGAELLSAAAVAGVYAAVWGKTVADEVVDSFLVSLVGGTLFLGALFVGGLLRFLDIFADPKVAIWVAFTGVVAEAIGLLTILLILSTIVASTLGSLGRRFDVKPVY